MHRRGLVVLAPRVLMTDVLVSDADSKKATPSSSSRSVKPLRRWSLFFGLPGLLMGAVWW